MYKDAKFWKNGFIEKMLMSKVHQGIINFILTFLKRYQKNLKENN